MKGVTKKILLAGKEVEYEFKTSTRARALRLSVYPGGSLVVTAPSFISEGRVEDFIVRKSHWVIKKIEQLSTFVGTFVRAKRTGGKREYSLLKDSSLTLVQNRVEHFNSIYQFKFNRISIRNQKTRWGSCSKRGNLSFNYRIVKLPAHLADYIIVHELCHLGEFNHSKKFWDLVARVIPNHRVLRRELKKVGSIF
jgi:predicted metal-dependent hydrolase